MPVAGREDGPNYNDIHELFQRLTAEGDHVSGRIANKISCVRARKRAYNPAIINERKPHVE